MTRKTKKDRIYAERSLFEKFREMKEEDCKKKEQKSLSELYAVAGIDPDGSADDHRRATIRLAAWGYGCARDVNDSRRR